MSGKFHAPETLPLGKKPPIPTEQEAGCAPELVCKQWLRENIPSLPLLKVGPWSSSLQLSPYTD